MGAAVHHALPVSFPSRSGRARTYTLLLLPDSSIPDIIGIVIIRAPGTLFCPSRFCSNEKDEDKKAALSEVGFHGMERLQGYRRTSPARPIQTRAGRSDAPRKFDAMSWL